MRPTPILAGIVGWPIEHSLSPLIHTIWAARAGIVGYYIPLAIAPDYDSFAAAMESLRRIGFAGVNVTIPHKEHALQYASTASDAAAAIGAANMVTFAEDGAAAAANTDGDGFKRALLGMNADPRTALVLGAGGAARAVLWSLARPGRDVRVDIANRTRARAEEIAPIGGAKVVEWAARHEALARADLIVNATSLGMAGAPPLELELAALKSGAMVADIVYSPLETPLLKAARARGHRVIDGLSMLMHQAAPGFRTWFDADCAVDDDLRGELVRELKRRGPA